MFGGYIYEKRRNRGLTQTGLAKLIGATQAQVSSWETNMDDPEPEMNARLADAIGYTEKEALEWARANPKRWLLTLPAETREFAILYYKADRETQEIIFHSLSLLAEFTKMEKESAQKAKMRKMQMAPFFDALIGSQAEADNRRRRRLCNALFDLDNARLKTMESFASGLLIET